MILANLNRQYAETYTWYLPTSLCKIGDNQLDKNGLQIKFDNA